MFPEAVAQVVAVFPEAGAGTVAATSIPAYSVSLTGKKGGGKAPPPEKLASFDLKTPQKLHVPPPLPAESVQNPSL